MTSLVKKYLALSQFSNQKENFEDLFLSHPNYPSVFAITDSLDTLSIENLAIKIPKEQLAELPGAFLAIYDNTIALVHKNEKEIFIVNEEGSKLNLTYNNFYAGWNGVVILIEPNTNTFSKNEKVNIKWIPYFLSLCALAVLSILYGSYSLNSVLLLLTSVVGFVISIFIVQEKLGIQNEMVSKLCNINSNASCDLVIKSNESEGNKWIHFSDLPLLYFGISFLSIILQPKDSSVIVGFIGLTSLPIIMYSIWLQKVQLKKWCVLCLIVSAVVISQSLIFSFTSQSFLNILTINFFGFLFSTVFFSAAWLFIKPILENKTKAEKTVNEFKRFKRNYTLFQFLTKEISVLKGFDRLEGLHFGNKSAAIQLTIIISPSCRHCHKTFEEAFELVSKFSKKVFLNVLFNINPENNNNPYKTIVEGLLTLNNSNRENIELAISDWHIKKMKLEEWKEKWPISIIDIRANHQIQEQYNWCLENEFNYTPVKIINNRLFPNEYKISDLKYFLHDFSEEYELMENNVIQI
ncbi:MAG: vitamin K epoxide reductase family protein [Flavobacterium sp.]